MKASGIGVEHESGREIDREAEDVPVVRIFERKSCRKAVAKRIGVGEDVHVRRVREPERAHMRGRQVGIVEERRRAPGREAAELDESLGHVRRGADGTRLAEEAAGVAE